MQRVGIWHCEETPKRKMTEIIAFIKKLPQVVMNLDIEVLSFMVHYAFTIVRLLQSQANRADTADTAA